MTPDERLAELAQAALLEIMETGTTSQKILVLPLIVPRPLPEKPKSEQGGFTTVHIVSEIDADTGQPRARELTPDEINRVKHERGADGVVSY